MFKVSVRIRAPRGELEEALGMEREEGGTWKRRVHPPPAARQLPSAPKCLFCRKLSLVKWEPRHPGGFMLPKSNDLLARGYKRGAPCL